MNLNSIASYSLSLFLAFFLTSCATQYGVGFATLIGLDILNDTEIGPFLKNRNANMQIQPNGSTVIQNTDETRDALIRLLRLLRERMNVIAENLANVNTTGAGSYREDDAIRYLPYRRKALKINPDGTSVIREDESPFLIMHDRGHPHANAEGVLLLPNVIPMMEMVDMLDTSRTYESILNVLKMFDPSIADLEYVP